jgi:hypothetical protein
MSPKSNVENDAVKPEKKPRKPLTQEQLDRLSVMREKALLKRRELKEAKLEDQVEYEVEKLKKKDQKPRAVRSKAKELAKQQVQEEKEELLKTPRAKRGDIVSIEKEKLIPKEQPKPKEPVLELEYESPPEEPPPKKPPKKEKKKLIKYVVEESESEEEVIIVKKKKEIKQKCYEELVPQQPVPQQPVPQQPILPTLYNPYTSDNINRFRYGR